MYRTRISNDYHTTYLQLRTFRILEHVIDMEYQIVKGINGNQTNFQGLAIVPREASGKNLGLFSSSTTYFLKCLANLSRIPNFVPAKQMEWKLFKKIWKYEYPNPDDLKKAFENQPKFQENKRNGWHVLDNSLTGFEILCNKKTKQFHLWYEGFGMSMTKEERDKPYYMWGGFMDGLILEYNDGINLFYNDLKAYEIFMDKFNTPEQRQELNPNYQEFKLLFPRLEQIYQELVNKGEIRELPQPKIEI